MAGESPDFSVGISELQAVLVGTESIDGFLREPPWRRGRWARAGSPCSPTAGR